MSDLNVDLSQEDMIQALLSWNASAVTFKTHEGAKYETGTI